MINFNNTINTTLYKYFNNLRYLAKNDTKAFKKILGAVILKDIVDIAMKYDKSQSIQHRLQLILTDYLLHNCEFNLIKVPESRKRIYD